MRKLTSLLLPLAAGLLMSIAAPAASAEGAPATQNPSAAAPAVPDARVAPGDKACMIVAAWLEARGMGEPAIRAVMHVVYNRMHHPAYRPTACGVLTQRGQFFGLARWMPVVRRAEAGDGSGRPVPHPGSDEGDVLRRMEVIADEVLAGEPDPTKCATHFYSPSERAGMALRRDPDWAREFPRVGSVGPFRLHRRPGGGCAPPAQAKR
jgi:hypothetical protein